MADQDRGYVLSDDVALRQRDLGLYFWAVERTLGALRLIDPETVPARPRLLKRKMRNAEEDR